APASQRLDQANGCALVVGAESHDVGSIIDRLQIVPPTSELHPPREAEPLHQSPEHRLLLAATHQHQVNVSGFGSDLRKSSEGKRVVLDRGKAPDHSDDEAVTHAHSFSEPTARRLRVRVYETTQLEPQRHDRYTVGPESQVPAKLIRLALADSHDPRRDASEDPLDRDDRGAVHRAEVAVEHMAVERV